MKKLFYPLSLITILMCSTLVTTTTSCSKADDPTPASDTTGNPDDNNPGVTFAKKYDIEKGMMVRRNYNTLMEGETLDTVYFKEYGAIEAKYVYDELNLLKEIKMQIGDGFLYSIYLKSNQGTKSEANTARGTEYSPDFEDWSQQYLTEYKVKILSDTVIAGRTCKFISYEANATTFVRVAEYKKIAMFFEVSTTGSMNFSVTYVCSKLDENAIIPDSKFKLPEGITYSDF